MVLPKFHFMLNYPWDQGLNNGTYYINLHFIALWGKGQAQLMVFPAFWS